MLLRINDEGTEEMRTDRFGREENEETVTLPFRKQCQLICTRRFIIIVIVVYMALYLITRTSIEPTPLITATEAALTCITLNIQTESGIRAGTLSYGNAETLPIHLYLISITRTINCTAPTGKEYVFQYKDDYLNISTVDVDRIYEGLNTQFPIGKSFSVWYYEDFCLWYRLRDRLDRHCLSSSAIEPSDIGDPAGAYGHIIMAHVMVAPLLIAGICVYWWFLFTSISTPRRSIV